MPEPDASVRIEFDGADYWRRWADQDRNHPEVPDAFIEMLEALGDAWESGNWEGFEGTLRSMDLEELGHTKGRLTRMFMDWNSLGAPDVMLGGVDALVKRVDRRIEELEDQKDQ